MEWVPLIFFLMFPPKQLILMVELTNHELVQLDLNATNTSELLKFFSVLILMTTYEFTSRASLWSLTALMKYRPAPHFGLTGMSKHQFEYLFRTVMCSKQPPERPENESSE
jgi:Transposase IS4